MSGLTADVVWPYSKLPPRTVTPEIVPATTGGGRSITAVEQIVAYDAGYWGIDYADIPFASRAHKIAWREVAGILDGRAGTCLVSVYDTGPQSTPPWPIVNGKYVQARPSYIDPDGTMGPGASIEAVLTADAAMGAVNIGMSLNKGSQLSAGMQFSLGVRLYRIKQILTSAGGGFLTTDGGSILTDDNGVPFGIPYTYTMKITPPLREAVTEGDAVNFSQPVCLCRLKTDNEMRAGDDYAGRTLAKVSFEEAINV